MERAIAAHLDFCHSGILKLTVTVGWLSTLAAKAAMGQNSSEKSLHSPSLVQAFLDLPVSIFLQGSQSLEYLQLPQLFKSDYYLYPLSHKSFSL